MRRLREIAARREVPLKVVVNEALREGLESMARPRDRHRYRQTTYDLGRPQMVQLDKALQLAAELENEETERKQDLRK